MWRHQLVLVVSIGAVLALACGGDDPDPAPAEPFTAQITEPEAAPVAADAPVSPVAVDQPMVVAPLPTPVTQTYTIQAGDTLWVIAARFGTTTAALIALNRLADPSVIVVGEDLIVREETVTIVPSAPKRSEMESVELLRVIDGDTIEIRRADGTAETLGYLGIEAPGRGEPLYAPATAMNAHFLAQGDLFVQAGVEERDPDGRLLRYVWLQQADGSVMFVNGSLVALGLASVTAVPQGMAHRDTNDVAQALARRAGRGLWAEQYLAGGSSEAAGGGASP